MSGSKIQARLLKGYGKAAKKIGFSYDVYRSATLIDPLAASNQIATVMASFTTGSTYGAFNRPSAPYWTTYVDATDLQKGDWLTNGELTYYIADIQQLLPIPSVGCTTQISIVRPGYEVHTGGGYGTKDVVIASNLPVFMTNKKDKSTSPDWFTSNTDSASAMPEWSFNINARTEGDVRAHDIIIDKMGTRYEITSLAFSSFGYIATARISKP
jgi:hypothetical protein